ncbi:MAG: ABC-F family ATP-binding cassette domain-containing protein [Bacilli bacterium]
MFVKNLNLIFGTETIFSDINIFIPSNEHIGIVGANGAGKTTFFKIILGLLEPDSGTIEFPNKERIGWLPQVITDEIPNTEITVLDYLLTGRPVKKLETEIEDIYTSLTNTTDEKVINKKLKTIAKLQDELDYYEPFTAEGQLLKLISGMNIDDKLLDQTLSSLSGGQKSKIAFARLLYAKQSLILLDEPTNHLDQDTKAYVTNYLSTYPGTVYIISHDLEFLNATTSKTLVLDKRTHKMQLYNGNYAKYIKIKTEQDLRLQKEVEHQQKEREHLQGIIDKYLHGNEKKANIAKDRQKKLAKLDEKTIVIEKNLRQASLSLHQGRESTSYPLKIKDLSFKYDKSSKTNLLHKINLEIPRGEKFLIVGENGAGKSTLLKLIVGTLTPDAGEIILGPKTDIGYYAQEHELLDNDKNLLDNLDEFDLTERDKKGLLGRFLFQYDEINKKVSVLSPGERSRLALAKLTAMKANLLILDEPTNHLDPPTQKLIANNLKDFPGTIILVSHNTEFVDNLGIERTLIIPSGKLAYYEKETVEMYHTINTKKKGV